MASLAVLIAAVAPAGAETPVKKKPAAERDTPARVTVQKRSFLDAGVEVKPGQRKFTDYAFPPGYSPTYSIDFTSGNVRGPLVGPWDTSRNNFWPW
ncbi:MAG TPA: hypothetical protein VGN55_18540 [Xanthobacteraceae bacterium]